VLVSEKMGNISSKLTLNESQCLYTGGEGYHPTNTLFPVHDSEVAAAASLFLVSITVGYIFRKRLESVFSYRQWRCSKSKQVRPFVERYMSNTNLFLPGL